MENEVEYKIEIDIQDEEGYEEYLDSEELFKEEEECEFEKLTAGASIENRIDATTELSDNLPSEIIAKNKSESKATKECKCDEFDDFGQEVAELLRSLNNQKHVQLDLKCKIIRAIMLANKLMSIAPK